LLSDANLPFAIDDDFTTLREIFQEALAQTNLEFDLRAFFMPKAEDNDLFNRSLEQVKIIPRSYMKDLQTFDKTKDVLNTLLEALRSRLYQLRGAWVLQRTTDYLYNTGDTYTGARYAFADGAYSADTLTCDLVTSLIPLSFSQTVTHKRPVVNIQDTFKLQPLPGIWNADLKELGALQSTATVGDIRTDKYAIPYWTSIGAGFANCFIVVETNELLETEIDRYLEVPYVSDPNFTGQQGLIFNPILVSVNDKFNFTFRIRSDTDSNLSAIVSAAVILIGNNGVKYRLTYVTNTNGLPLYTWNTTTETVDTVTTSTIQFGQRGGTDNREYDEVALIPATGDRVEVRLLRFPVNGVLYIKLGAYKNNTANYADLKAEITDINFEYTFYVNDSLLIESQKHTATSLIESLNVEEKEIEADDCIKYSAAGALYDKDNANTNLWVRFDGDTTPAKLGELNVVEQLSLSGEGRRVISGNFEGVFDFNQFASFDAARFIPTRLAIDLHRQQVEGEFTELVAASALTYEFDYLYKTSR
jgi:hypothetical protein